MTCLNFTLANIRTSPIFSFFLLQHSQTREAASQHAKIAKNRTTRYEFIVPGRIEINQWIDGGEFSMDVSNNGIWCRTRCSEYLIRACQLSAVVSVLVCRCVSVKEIFLLPAWPQPQPQDSPVLWLPCPCTNFTVNHLSYVYVYLYGTCSPDTTCTGSTKLTVLYGSIYIYSTRIRSIIFF